MSTCNCTKKHRSLNANMKLSGQVFFFGRAFHLDEKFASRTPVPCRSLPDGADENRVSGLLMEIGVSYNKSRLHKVGYFAKLLSSNEEVNQSIRPLLKLSRETIVRSQKLLTERLKRLRTVPGVGPITALTWALEIGDFTRFRSIKQAISYCGLCVGEKSSADKMMRMSLSSSAISIFNEYWWRLRNWPRESAMNWPWSGTEKCREETQIAPRWPWPGRWSVICSRWSTGSRISCLPRNSKPPRQRKNPSTKEGTKHQDSSMRRLPGPADRRLSEGGHAPEALFELFRDWQRTQTQSSVRTPRGLRQQMDVRFCKSTDHQPRGNYCGW